MLTILNISTYFIIAAKIKKILCYFREIVGSLVNINIYRTTHKNKKNRGHPCHLGV